MRHRFRCNSCSGEYFDRDRDGTIYHHVCADASEEITGKAQHAPRRDENVRVDRTGAAIGIRSEGNGVVCLSDPQLTEPKWITRLKAAQPPEEEA